MSQPSLIFVYNANSGMWNTMLDTIHKTVSPETYQCIRWIWTAVGFV